jgi:hypothetical protein
MLRVAQHVGDTAMLDDLAFAHHGDVIADFGDHTKIVSNEHDTHAAFGLRLLQQRQNLLLRRHVECRCGLIGDQQLGIEC